jgi:hypothetical protein
LERSRKLDREAGSYREKQEVRQRSRKLDRGRKFDREAGS